MYECITEYDEAKYSELVRADGYAIGYAEGIKIGSIRTLLSLIEDGVITEKDAAEYMELTVEDFRKTAEEYCNGIILGD